MYIIRLSMRYTFIINLFRDTYVILFFIFIVKLKKSLIARDRDVHLF
jgi:hypothetical protein